MAAAAADDDEDDVVAAVAVAADDFETLLQRMKSFPSEERISKPINDDAIGDDADASDDDDDDVAVVAADNRNRPFRVDEDRD